MSEQTFGMWVTIDRQRVLERFTSEDLLSEVSLRKAKPLPEARQESEDAILDAIREAIAYLRSGRTDDALLTLERSAYPKFKSFDDAAAQYLRSVKA